MTNKHIKACDIMKAEAWKSGREAIADREQSVRTKSEADCHGRLEEFA